MALVGPGKPSRRTKNTFKREYPQSLVNPGKAIILGNITQAREVLREKTKNSLKGKTKSVNLGSEEVSGDKSGDETREVRPCVMGHDWGGRLFACIELVRNLRLGKQAENAIPAKLEN